MLVLSQGSPVFMFQMGWRVLSGWLEQGRDGVTSTFHGNVVIDVRRRHLRVSYSFSDYVGGKPKYFSLYFRKKKVLPSHVGNNFQTPLHLRCLMCLYFKRSSG